MNAKEIGKRIQNLRKEKGLTQQELADKLSITLSMQSLIAVACKLIRVFYKGESMRADKRYC